MRNPQNLWHGKFTVFNTYWMHSIYIIYIYIIYMYIYIYIIYMYIYIYNLYVYIYIYSCMYYMRTGIIHPHLPAKGPTCVDLPRILYRLDATALRPGQRVVIGKWWWDCRNSKWWPVWIIHRTIHINYTGNFWLVVWNMNGLFSIYWEFHHPNWRTHIFQRGWNHQPDYIDSPV